MTTPVQATTDPAVELAGARARAALGVALGVVVPEAMGLADGRVRLTGSRDMLSKEAMDRLDERLSRRAGEDVSDLRLLTEAVAALGAEIDHARGGSSPVDGATLALDRLLDVPDLPAETQAEAQSMLRAVLEGNATTTESAARRLATERAAEQARQRPPLVADTVEAAREINRDAQVLTHVSTPPTTARTGSGRHRRVGSRHRRRPDPRIDQRTVGTPGVAGTGFVAGGRPVLERDLDEDEALAGLLKVQPSDLSSGIDAPMRVIDRPRLGVVSTTDHGLQYFRVSTSEPPRGLLAQTTLRAGSITDPHVIQISPRLENAQLPRVWTNQISRTLQQVEARAAAPKSLLRRFRSALSGLRGRDRNATAQYDEFRLLGRNWREAQLAAATGQPASGRGVAELERELQGLAVAIAKRGQPAPALPWAAEARHVLAPDRTVAAVAPNSAAHLREKVVTEIAGLQAAAADLEARSTARLAGATAASALATKNLEDAATEDGYKDDAAPERARKLRVTAGHATRKAERHTAIATSCQTAADQAKEAGQAYQALLTKLTELEASGQEPGTDVLVLAQTAADRVGEYQAAVAATLPSADVLHTATTSGRLPHLTALTRDINQALAKQGDNFRFTPELLHRRLRAETRRLLSPDGVVLTVGNDPRVDVSELTQFKIQLRPGELREVLDSPLTFDEGMLGQLEQGGYSVSTTATQTTSYNGGISLKTLMAAFPDSSQLKAASQFVSPGFEFAVGQTHSVTSTGTEYGLGGAVELINGETLRYRSDTPSWGWQMRTSAVAEWSQPQVVDSGDLQDADVLDVGIAHSYTVAPPEETVDLDQLGLAAERSDELPEHVASRVDGLSDLADQGVAGLRERLGSLDRVGHDQLRGLLIEDAPSRLDEATRPGGIGRIITHGGRPVAYAQLETVAVPESAELLSDSSPEHKVERLRVGFSGASGNQSFGANNSASATLGYPGSGLSDLGTTDVDFGPTVKGGRSVSREEGVSTGDTAIHPSVQRTGPTVGVKIRLVHKLTIHRIDKDESFSLDGKGDAVLRTPENAAFRHGWPVPKDALVLGPSGKLQRGMDGRVLLRGDPQPTDKPLKLPVWMGNGKGQLRGAGPALVQDLKGADPALKAFVKHLSAEGLVPQLDAKGRPRLKELAGKDPALVASQLANLERVSQHVSRHRLETGYDQACQGGLLFALTKHHTGRPPEEHSYRIDITQHLHRAKPLGINSSQTAVNLHIGSNTTVRSGGRSKGLPWLAKFGFSNKAGQGQAGSTPEIGPSYGRSALGRFFGWATGSTVNGVSLTESTAPLMDTEIPQTITIREVFRDGDSKPIVEVEGSAKLSIDSEFCDRGEPTTLSIDGRVNPALLQTATVQHVDAGNALSRLTAALPAAARADSAALHHLAAFVNVRNLSAHPELLTTEYRTQFAVSPVPSDLAQAIAQRGLTPQQASLSLRARVENVKYVGSGHPVIGDINLTLGSSSFTASSSTGNTAGLGGGSGMAEADGDSWGGSAGLSRSGSLSASSTETTIGGVERLNIKDGQHYQFVGDLVLDAEIRSAGMQPQKVELEDGAVMLTVPERDALQLYGKKKLDLPLAKVSDAVERLLDDNLSLDRRTSAALIRRYQVEKAGVTEGLAPTHTDERLADKLRSLAGVKKPAAQPEKFEQIVADAEKVAAQRVEVRLPDHYRNTMGAGLIDRDALVDANDKESDILREVRAAVAERSPDALDDPALATALRSDLAGTRWRGHIDDMLDPRGFVKEYPIGSGTPRNVTVRVRLVFDGPVTTDGEPDDPAAGKTENAFNIVQIYDYDESGRSVTSSIGYSANIGGASTDGGAGSAGLSTDLGTSTTAASVEQNTRMSRGLWQKTKRVERDFRVVVEVEGKQQPPVRRESSGRMTMLVPKSDINPRPRAQLEVTDHRTATLPSSYFLRGTQTYLPDEEEVDNLFDTAYARLAERDMLTVAGVQLHKTTLENQLSASARMAAFERINSAEGHWTTPLPVPGHGSRAVAVRVRAEISGVVLESDPEDDDAVQLGEIDREQQITQTTIKSGRLLPTGRTIGGGNPGTDLKVGMSGGEQVTEKDTDTTGNRNETSKFESGAVVTVKVLVDYHLDFERSKIDRHNNRKTDRSDTIQKAATGEAYVTMFRHEYDAIRARMEAGAPPLQNWDPSKSAAMAKKVPERRVQGHEVATNGNGQAEHHPYRPMVEALAQARKEGVAVVLTMHQQDGKKQVYKAMPDGTMTSKDDGFAAAFATLHPQLALLAEGRVDLRQLYESGDHGGRFTGTVVKALQDKGIPASALAELDHSLSANRASGGQVGADGAKQPVGRGSTGKSGTGMAVQ